MKLQFDPNQPYQLDTVAAVTDLCDGQPQDAPEYAVIHAEDIGGLFADQTRTGLGVGNHLLLPEEKLHANTRAVQAHNNIEVAYFELSRRYGFQKFIIVVPSVAIREGVLENIEITGEHFRALYNNLPFASFVYDAKRVNRLRQFAVNNTLQILVINIDAFRKNFTGTEEAQKSNVIYKESDKLSGRQPIEFVQAACPIVIIDEPQSVDATDKAQEAIKALNPLCTLRYSATHRNPYNLVYRLDPVRYLLAYLQNETELTRSTWVRILKASSRLAEFFVDLQRFMDAVAAILKHELHRLLVDGSKYERLPSTEPQAAWELRPASF